MVEHGDTANVLQAPGAALVEWRKQNKVSRADLAARTGISEPFIKAIEIKGNFPAEEYSDKLFAATHLPHFADHGNAARPIRRTTKGMKGRWKNPRGEKMRGIANTGAQKEPEARILRLFLLEGKSSEEIGDALGYKPSVSKIEGREVRRHKSIRKRLKRILGIEELRLLHGSSMDHVCFAGFHRNFGEPSNKQLAAALGVGERHVWNLLRDGSGVRLLTPELCEKVRACEQAFIARLMTDRGHRANHFKSVVPDLAERLNAASFAIAQFQNVIDKSFDEQDQILNSLAAIARREATARSALCMLPALIPWLKNNLAELERKHKDVAVLFVAHDYGVKVWIVQHAAYSKKIEASPRGEIRALLFPPMHTAPAKPKSPEKKPEKRIPDWMVKKGTFCIQVSDEVRSIHRLHQRDGLSIAEIKQRHANFAVWEVRDALGGEDREHFNHPARWEAPIGYAKALLAKDQGVSAFTIADWMKACRHQQRATDTANS